MTNFLQLLLSGILVGGIYALLALGIVIIYKSSGIFNFAQGAMVALGGYVTWSLLVQVGLSWPLAIIATIVIAFLIAMAIERFALRPLIGQPLLAALMLTIALGLVLSGIVALIWPGPGRVFPPLIPTGSVELGDIALSAGNLISFGVCMVVFVIFVIFFRRSRMGLAMRGTSEDQQLSQSCGVKVTTVFVVCWFIAMLVGAACGTLISSIHILEAQILAAYGMIAFPAVLLGGLESIPGAIIGGLIIGIVELLSAGYLDPIVGGGAGGIMPFVVMLIIVIVRPFGIFGYKRIERV